MHALLPHCMAITIPGTQSCDHACLQVAFKQPLQACHAVCSYVAVVIQEKRESLGYDDGDPDHDHDHDTIHRS